MGTSRGMPGAMGGLRRRVRMKISPVSSLASRARVGRGAKGEADAFGAEARRGMGTMRDGCMERAEERRIAEGAGRGTRSLGVPCALSLFVRRPFRASFAPPPSSFAFHPRPRRAVPGAGGGGVSGVVGVRLRRPLALRPRRITVASLRRCPRPRRPSRPRALQGARGSCRGALRHHPGEASAQQAPLREGCPPGRVARRR